MANRGREDKNYYFEFEKWALSLIAAQPGNLGKKGADKGIDGNIYFGKTHRAIVSVKAGDNVGVGMIRDLRGVIERERAEIGIFLTLTEPKKTMVAEAAGGRTVRDGGLRPGAAHPDRHHRGGVAICATAPCACPPAATTPSSAPRARKTGRAGARRAGL